MGRKAVWTAIYDALSLEIAEGLYGIGDRLPTEAALSARFGVNRHTVRRALSVMSDAGLVVARRGAGVFVAATPTDYPIGSKMRFHQNIEAAGRLPGKEILTLETRFANVEERAALNLDEGDKVYSYDGLSKADDQPVAIFRSVFPAHRFTNLTERLDRLRSVTAALKEEGIEFTRSHTRISAVVADPTQAGLLRLQQGAPLIKTIGLNVCAAGRPVEHGTTWFAGDRVTLTVDTD